MNLLPTTVLCGFLGAGKTTVLNHVLQNRAGLRVAVIVNDMSSINIDAQLIRNGEAALSRTDEKMVEMTNGCICCTLRADLLKEVVELAREGRFDYLLIESTGISEPLPIAETFTFTGDDGQSLAEIARLDTMVTVVDAYNFMHDMKKNEDLRLRNPAKSANDERDIVDLLVDQVEFADILLLNKIDLVSAEELDQLEALLHRMNPGIPILRIDHGRVPVQEILNTHRFTFERAAMSPQWLIEAPGEHIPETEEYGISSFVYRAHRPFHPERLMQILEQCNLPGVVRSKGVLWLATRHHFASNWSQAGAIITISAGGVWGTTTIQEGLNGSDIPHQHLSTYGDRRQEIVFIGIKMDRDQITHTLNGALLTDEEMAIGWEQWNTFPNPFATWDQAIEAGLTHEQAVYSTHVAKTN